MGRTLLTLFALPTVLCALAVLCSQPFHLGAALVNVALFPLLTLAGMVLHEGGHMAAARALGLQVPRVQLGVGRPLLRWRWARTLVTLHGLPLMGMTFVGGRIRGHRWRYWLSVAAGPLVTVGLVAGTLAAVGWSDRQDVLFPIEVMASRPAPLELLGFTSAWMLFWNLLPLPLFRSIGLARNDGTQLLTLPFWTERRLELLEITPGLLEAEERRERGDVAGASVVLDGLRARFPGSWGVLNSVALVQMDGGLLAEARVTLLALLQTEPPLPDFRWPVRNNLAWVNYRLRVDDLRAEADEHSAAVHRRHKNTGWALGTRGAVLSWLGRPVEAIPLLERAYVLNSTPQSRALNACGLAVALAESGRTRDALVWLDRARTNDPRCALLPEAEAAIARRI